MADEKHNLITWLGFTTEPDFSKARLLGHAIGYGFVALYVCVFALLVGGLMWTITHVPDIIGDVIYATDPTEARWLLASLAALTAVTSAAVALPFTILKTIYNRRQTEVAEQSHITDQINKAVENLGATRQVGEQLLPNIQARIGGLVTLERIARSNRTVYLELMEVVAAYMVESLPETFRPNEVDRLRADLARCLQIISNRTDKDIEFEQANGWQMNLDDVDFRAKILESVKFRNVSLHQADFRHSAINDVTFSDVDGRFQKFDLANISSVNFDKINLVDATFKLAFLSDVNFAYVLGLTNEKIARASGLLEENFLGASFRRMQLPPLMHYRQPPLDTVFGDHSVKPFKETLFPDHWPTSPLAGDAQEKASAWKASIKYDARRNELLTEIGFDGDAPTG